ncbi:MAG TPA: hypothetical protein P5290_05850 [Candidatus Methanomethylicus sp.]|nr:hypothetical protein [Candidatus Methanomethylicus sp.]
MSRHKCPYCSLVFQSFGLLKAHIRYEELKGNRCPVCRRSFLAVQNHIALSARLRDPSHQLLYAFVSKYSKGGARLEFEHNGQIMTVAQLIPEVIEMTRVQEVPA